MVEKDRIIRVQNRDFGRVGYGIPDLNLRREFMPNEVKDITFDELFKLLQTPGGDYIINNYLIIYDDEVVKELLNDVEPEYYYTEEQVKKLMLSGSLDELEDCLNFAPNGVIDLIKEISVRLPLNDVAKRDLILKKTGFSVANAIELAKTDDVIITETPKRKAAAPQVTRPVRKVVKPTK